ncbi:MAG: hypothetical protein E7409_02740 [Ruminococcaceae bacterium]|nr:hypothetical protein [Oscillospiraceae bacterium]
MLKSFCDRLGIAYNQALFPYYEKGLLLKREKGLFVVDTERLNRLNNKYNIFRKWYKEVTQACAAISKDDDLILFIYILVVLIQEKASISSLLQMPDRQRLDTDMAPLFAFLYFLEEMISDYQGRGVPHEIISDTLNGFDTEMNDYFDIYARPGIRTYVEWFLLFARREILRIGRFQFQITTLNEHIRVYQKNADIKIMMDGETMHTKGMVFGSKNQDDEEGRYYAEITEKNGAVSGYCANEYGECVPKEISLVGYKEILRRGDRVISVHIPSHAPLTKEMCDESYAKAWEVFATCYPEYDFKAFYCFSWMMDKRLRQIMGKDTNITLFADKYTIFPTKDSGEDIYSFLYHLPEPVAAENLPEHSSMQRAVKQYLMQGNVLYTKSGIMLLDE